MIWKHKLTIVVVTAVMSAALSVVVYKLPSIYEASSLIMVDRQKIPEEYVSSTVQISIQHSLVDAVRQQVLNGTRLQNFIDNFGLYANERKTKSREEILDMMRTDVTTPMHKGFGGGRPGAFKVVYRGRDPKVVAAVVNEISNLFVEENLRTREMSAEDTSEFIE